MFLEASASPGREGTRAGAWGQHGTLGSLGRQGSMHEALLPALALFTFTLYWVDTVDRQNLLIALVSLRCVV